MATSFSQVEEIADRAACDLGTLAIRLAQWEQIQFRFGKKPAVDAMTSFTRQLKATLRPNEICGRLSDDILFCILVTKVDAAHLRRRVEELQSALTFDEPIYSAFYHVTPEIVGTIRAPGDKELARVFQGNSIGNWRRGTTTASIRRRRRSRTPLRLGKIVSPLAARLAASPNKHRAGRSALQLVYRDRQIADALARRMMDGVGDRGGDADDADLAQALDAEAIDLGVGLVDEDDLDLSNVGVHGDMVFGDVGVHDPAEFMVDQRLLMQRHADAPDHAADDLAARGLGVEDASRRRRR